MSSRAIRRLGGEGILTEDDLKDLSAQRKAVATLMNDGRWYPASAILSAAGGTEGLRRMRELRDLPGIDVERKKGPTGSRTFLYRMVRS